MFFVEVTLKDIVLKNSNYFQNVKLCTPTVSFQEDEFQQQARGPFQVKTNSILQNLIELALAAVTLRYEPKEVVSLMHNALVNLTDDSVAHLKVLIERKQSEVIENLYDMVKHIIKNHGAIKLADVYKLATELVGKFEKIGIQFTDLPRERRKIIMVRPEHVPRLREKHEAYPRRFELYMRYMMMLHEEGHPSSVSVLAHQLQTVFSLKKVEILDVFRALIKGDWPKYFIQQGFRPLSDKDKNEYRSQVDVIVQTLWLLRKHPQRKELFGVYWTEAVANYYAYLKIKEQVENDNLAIEALSLGIHYSLELNPPKLKNLSFVLVNAVNSFFPFLSSVERKDIIKRILELQIEENGVFAEKAKIEFERIEPEKTSRNLLGKFENTFVATILLFLFWAKVGYASNNAVFSSNVMNVWVAAGVIVGAMGTLNSR